MNAVKVIIKATNYTDAAIAAATHNLVFHESSYTAHERIGTVSPRTDRTDVMTRVVEWFCDKAGDTFPCPSGTLMWHGNLDAEGR